jgi:hypothetical protein
VATQRIGLSPQISALGEAEQALARSLHSLLEAEAQSPEAAEDLSDEGQTHLHVLEAGEDSPRSFDAVVWGINFLRGQIGVIPRLSVTGIEPTSEAERTTFLNDFIRMELKRQKLLEFLSRTEPAWKDEDHPDIAEIGAAAWVHNMRQEKSLRLAGRDDNLDPL